MIVLADGVRCLTLSGFVNVYFVEHSAGWALIDSGTPWHFGRIRDAARALFGDAPPTGIFLTHGHYDHAGSALALATYWDVQIFASEAELPFLTGKLDYPPGDPSVGGPMGFFARFASSKGFDLGERVRALELAPLPPAPSPRSDSRFAGTREGGDTEELPSLRPDEVGERPKGGVGGGMPGWQAIPLPGHSPGQVGFWRESDKTLLAGDAVTTRELNEWARMLRGEERIGMPPAPFTVDWFAVRKSVLKIGELQPEALGAGHGRPLSGDELKTKLASFLEYGTIARKGRYVAQPVTVRDDGTLDVRPVPPDPVEKAAKLLVLGAVVGLGAWWLSSRKRAGGDG